VATLLGMFAKLWQPGQVKTRLAATLGPARAAAVQRLFLLTLAARFAGVADERVLVFAPASAEPAFRAVVAGAWRLAPQAEGDLGARMRRFFDDNLARAQRVVLIGSDSPDLPAEHLKEAFGSLESRDVVLGPAADGGYYLVGAARRVPPIFDDIAWSTPEVWAQTMARLQADGTSWHKLPPWYDVDTQEGLAALLTRLKQQRGIDAPLAALETGLLEILCDAAG
jgi:rSAM/selenodomain-associated transferase 1